MQDNHPPQQLLLPSLILMLGCSFYAYYWTPPPNCFTSLTPKESNISVTLVPSLAEHY